VLFTGASPTDKAQAAEAIASELKVRLLHVDLSQVVSKHIGETERNLDRVFAEATAGNTVLLFDEADALFGRRSEITGAHDRHQNVEASHLLERIEGYSGIVILATNMRHSGDESFVRRMKHVLEFPRRG
jgi:SpoVK/Ycf46/Vps4 family AAA+-type ATPase